MLRDALLNNDDAAIAKAERSALEGVVARHRDQPFSFEPVTVEIVAALIGIAFHVRVEQSPTCRDMTRTIANSLWGDPVIRDRIEMLWCRMAEPT